MRGWRSLHVALTAGPQQSPHPLSRLLMDGWLRRDQQTTRDQRIFHQAAESVLYRLQLAEKATTLPCHDSSQERLDVAENIKLHKAGIVSKPDQPILLDLSCKRLQLSLGCVLRNLTCKDIVNSLPFCPSQTGLIIDIFHSLALNITKLYFHGSTRRARLSEPPRVRERMEQK